MSSTKELRNPNATMDNTRINCTYKSREKLSPEGALRMILLNIFHGAGDRLRTRWEADEWELKQMARENVLYGISKIFVGVGWRTELGARQLNTKALVENFLLRDSGGSDRGLFWDGSKRVVHTTEWTGIGEFFSGNQLEDIADQGALSAFKNQKWYRVQVLSASNEKCSGYQSIRLHSKDFPASKKSLWLRVKMAWRTTIRDGISLGKVDWWKVVHGKSGASLKSAIENKNNPLVAEALVREVLEQQLGKDMFQISLSENHNFSATHSKCQNSIFAADPKNGNMYLVVFRNISFPN